MSTAQSRDVKKKKTFSVMKLKLDEVPAQSASYMQRISGNKIGDKHGATFIIFSRISCQVLADAEFESWLHVTAALFISLRSVLLRSSVIALCAVLVSFGILSSLGMLAIQITRGVKRGF